MTNDLQLAERDRELAKKSTWLTAFLTSFFLIPPIGYFYTARYKPLLIGLAIIFGLCGLVDAGKSSSKDEDDALGGLYLIYVVASTVENARAVHQAKKRGSEANSHQNSRNLKVEILRFMKGKEDVSLADLVLETGLDSKEVLELVNDLERESLIRGYNRASDGAVVYRII
ncbi:hypothetical protein [Oscillatoria sp. FACHB-1406]|uniref:hypothetical protein n=1 Tax=Oscillatoria sp. FACHB-1406 TaxID=2692846 RepID=UPI001685DAA1|nr:hypothetical protein [Oscillatoria sp. FACHB-1406]MBD2579515.1 hypothetical protein [Oscillatoria sp. FACHB-1406]